MDEVVEATLRGLRSRHLNAFFTENSEIARAEILKLIPMNAVVGIGDSTTVAQIGVKQELKRRGTTVLDGFDRGTQYSVEDRRRLVNESTMCDVFLAGTNAVTEEGKLVNVDATGNRVAGMFWGHPMSVIVVGRNKIVRNLDEAFHRIRHVIAPNHVRIRALDLGGQGRETPCLTTGRCTDCRAVDRLCNVFTVIEGKPSRTSIHVVLIDEDLGLGWDEAWPKERVDRIVENYKRFVWIPR